MLAWPLEADGSHSDLGAHSACAQCHTNLLPANCRTMFVCEGVVMKKSNLLSKDHRGLLVMTGRDASLVEVSDSEDDDHTSWTVLEHWHYDMVGTSAARRVKP